MNESKKKSIKKKVRKTEEDLGIDPDSLLGGVLAAGIASLFYDDEDESDEDEDEESSDSIFDSDTSDDSDSGDFGDGDFGGGGSSDDW